MSLKFARRKARADGNCFFHSLAQLLVKDWVQEQETENGQTLRLLIAQKFSLDHYLQIYDSNLALMNLLARPEYSSLTLDAQGLIDLFHKSEAVHTCIIQDWERHREAIENVTVWAEEWMIAISATVLGVNILIYTSDNIWLSPRSLQPGKAVVTIFNWKDSHYDPLFMAVEDRLFKSVSWENAEQIIKLVK